MKFGIFFSLIEMVEYNIDFGNIDPSGEINGLIGLDLLTSLHAVIDIDIPFIYLKKE